MGNNELFGSGVVVSKTWEIYRYIVFNFKMIYF